MYSSEVQPRICISWQYHIWLLLCDPVSKLLFLCSFTMLFKFALPESCIFQVHLFTADHIWRECDRLSCISEARTAEIPHRKKLTVYVRLCVYVASHRGLYRVPLHASSARAALSCTLSKLFGPQIM
jgi:hypothetical protein